MAQYDSDYEIRLATLDAMGGDVTKHYDSVYAIDLEILSLTEQGGGGSGITYTAGDGINISNEHVISVDTTTVQPKLTAGSGITIDENNQISVNVNYVKSVVCTQAEYDAMVSAGTIDIHTLYIISD